MRTLLIGIGNGSRGDDALGWLFLNDIEGKDPGRFDLEYRYQLQVEDADIISKYERVLFVDATEELIPKGYALKKCEPARSYYFSSHLQSPEAVLYLCETLYRKTPEAYVLPIKGYRWELGEPLSNKASNHLQRALDLFRSSELYKQAQIKEIETEELF
ncbi:hydrogenase maturation protease [Rhodohalobacter sp.]|uniref:hydrogenase maturation protease n=1 Tax=Rhodohalobacter sp. TaxID=1974210 RepID=UPI002ACEC39D|nr:hydrogenase maturation protease [Rhodohalobacter sp.]MDZ7755106.1 hydrogenase maturation protease [Rhodohalobacter sp.]